MKARLVKLQEVARRDPSALFHSLILVPAVGTAVRFRGLQPTAERLARWSDVRAVAPDFERAAFAYDAVRVAARVSPISARCLAQSLSLWFLLRRRGLDVELVIGALPPKGEALAAHAWVELDGRPLNDQADVRDRFGSFGITFPRLLPS